MSRFKFRLERVLQVREIQEEQAKQEWAVQERLAYEEKQKLAALHAQRQEVISFGYNQSELALRQAMFNFLAALERRIEKQTLKLQEQEDKALAAKEIWLAARQETKKVSTLREKQYTAFVKEELRKEQKILDDMRSHLVD